MALVCSQCRGSVSLVAGIGPTAGDTPSVFLAESHARLNLAPIPPDGSDARLELVRQGTRAGPCRGEPLEAIGFRRKLDLPIGRAAGRPRLIQRQSALTLKPNNKVLLLQRHVAHSC